MEEHSTNVGGYSRATASGPIRYYRRNPGPKSPTRYSPGGSKYRPHRYSSPGGHYPQKPQPGRPMYTKPGRPVFNPLINKSGQFGRRGLTAPGPFVSKTLQKQAASTMLRAAKLGLGKIILGNLGIAVDLYNIAAGLYSGTKPGQGMSDFASDYPVSDYYDCPTINPPYPEGPAYRMIGWGGTTIPDIFKCLPGQVPDSATPDYVPTVTTGDGTVSYMMMRGPSALDGQRMSYDEIWMVRVPPHQTNQPLGYWLPPTPSFVPYPDPFPEPLRNPLIPAHTNPLRPGTFPPNLPYKDINSRPRDPNSESGYGPGAPSTAAPDPNGPPFIRIPHHIPPSIFNPNPNGPRPGIPNITPPVGPEVHEPRPPNPHEKERKREFPLSPFVRAVRGIYGKYTEGKDAANAVYDALPAGRKKEDWRRNGFRPLTLQQKLKSLYDHANEIDMGKALHNLARNELQDRAIGKLAKGARTITRNPYWRRPVGPQAGDRFRQAPFVKVTPVV